MPARDTKDTPARRHGTPWRPKFLEALARTGNVLVSCRMAGLKSRKTAYRAREQSAAFAAAWDEALEEATDLLDNEARRRAMNGVETPIYHKGVAIGTEKRYSDQLLIFLLKAHRRKVYGDKSQLDVTSGGSAVRTVFYIPENGRDAPNGDPAAGGAADDVPDDPG